MDDLKAIGKQLPTTEEVSHRHYQFLHLKVIVFQVGRIRDFEDVSKLAKADQYFSEVCVFSVSDVRN